ALFIGVYVQLEPMLAREAVAEREHLAKLPGGVDVEQRQGWRRGVEGAQREMGEHGGVLASGKQEHRLACLRHGLAQDENGLVLQVCEMAGVREGILVTRVHGRGPPLATTGRAGHGSVRGHPAAPRSARRDPCRLLRAAAGTAAAPAGPE